MYSNYSLCRTGGATPGVLAKLLCSSTNEAYYLIRLFRLRTIEAFFLLSYEKKFAGVTSDITHYTSHSFVTKLCDRTTHL